MAHKIVNGIQVELTAEEIAQRQADEQAWNAGAFDRAMTDLRNNRNIALKNSDWSVLPDVTLTPAEKAAWMNYRTLLRNITENVLTLEEVQSITLPLPPK